MMLLALDTSTGWMTAALWTDAGLLDKHAEELDRAMLARCPVRVDAMLRRAGVTPEDLTACAAGLGPGSYTGLRIGLSLMQGIAAAREIPLYGIASSSVLAAAVTGLSAVFVLQESGRRTGHAAVSSYDTTVFPPSELMAPRLILPAELPGLWRGDGIAIGDAAARILNQFPELGVPAASPELNVPRADLLARIGHCRWQARDPGDPTVVQGIYLVAPPLPQRKTAPG